MAVGFGADAIGLVGPMPSGPGMIPDADIRDIARTIPPPVQSWLLTSAVHYTEIVAHHRRTRTQSIQLVDALPIDQYQLLRQALPGVALVQVIHVQDDQAIAEAQRVAPFVDALLLDSGNPRAATQILGGTGKTHEWSISGRIVAEVAQPVFLAGGLRADNIRQAIAEVSPFGVDLCTGVRTDGALDARKLEAFFQAVYSG